MIYRPLIVAIATPPGQGGIGVIRASGSQATIHYLAEELLGLCPKPRHAWYTSFLDAHNDTLDRGIALYFPAPHSFTGEYVLELQAHGGSAILELLLQRCIECGARLAEPGEFTQRAFLNGKIDLAQAEAIADMISATTAQAARAASRSMTGIFSEHIHALVEELITLRTLVEALIDFPDEELDFLTRYPIREPLEVLLHRVQALLKKAYTGHWLQRGVHVVLLGAPNVGKSSLLNHLAGEEIAIVTPIAGTTRDPIRHALQIRGIPIHLVDTAGVRHTTDTIEQLGIERSWKVAKQADIVIVIQACDSPSSPQELASWSDSIPQDVPRIWLYNKVDTIPGSIARKEYDSTQNVTSVYCSVRTGEGICLLEEAILETLAIELSPAEDSFMARTRHLEALRLAEQHLQSAMTLWDEHQQYNQVPPLEWLAEFLRDAQNALSSITGEFSADDLLGMIFGQFCIGK